MPRARLAVAEAMPSLVRAPGTPDESNRSDTSGTPPGSKRLKRCTVRRLVKLTPRQDAMLLALAHARGTNASEVLKHLLERAWAESEGRA